MLSDAFVSLTFQMFMMNLVLPNFTALYFKIHYVTLADDKWKVDGEGEEHEFELVKIIELKEQGYAVLFPLEGDDDDKAVILRIEADENDEDGLVDITDEDEWNKVVAAWEELVAEDDEDDDDEEEKEEEKK